MAGNIENWTPEDVAYMLEENHLQQYVALFRDEHKIDGPALLSLTEADLRQPPIQLQVLGDIKRLMICIHKLQRRNPCLMREICVPNGDAPMKGHLVSKRRTQRRTFNRSDSKESSLTDDSHAEDVDTETDFTRDNIVPFSYSEGYRRSKLTGKKSHHLHPEIWKTILSFLYVFAVFLLTSFVMVIVHDRVPDKRKYPPLPDLFLDNMPYVPWAFQACEVIGVLLGLIWCNILVFHKHRFILMRRMFSLTGTVFLLRCFTMLITSLSVPGEHQQCEGKAYGDIWVKLHRTFVIWKGFGMTLQGVRTCGDYMFSGHTIVITMFNFFITEYTPQSGMYYLHTVTWVLNLFGIFFILAAHEHYSIDVFVAFYITSRLFLYYQTLANNRALMQSDCQRTRIWFPLFSFFESECNGIVPNEYQWPLRWPKVLKAYVAYILGKKRI